MNTTLNEYLSELPFRLCRL